MGKRVAVVGAGISGILSAYYAAKAGHQVAVFESESHAGMRCSFANGGQISVSNSEVWTTKANLLKSIKWMFKKDAPLLFKPWRIDWAMWRWAFKFIGYTLSGVHHKNTAETIRMGIESRKLYDEICQEEAIEFDRSDTGIIHFFKTESYYNDALDMLDVYQENGLDRRAISPRNLRTRDRALAWIDAIGATETPSDWSGDIHKFCYEMSRILKYKYDVRFFYDYPVNRISDIEELYDHIIIANGVGSTRLAKSVGDTIDVYPVKGYSITVNNVAEHYLPKVCLLDDEAKIVTSTLGNRFRVAGTAEFAGENYDIRRERIEPLLNWVKENFPNINLHDYSQWACLRPMTPNMMPITKKSDKHAKVLYNTGHGHLGWTLGAYTAKKVVDLL